MIGHFPPSFAGNPWSYSLALFGDLLACALALAILIHYWFEIRRSGSCVLTIPTRDGPLLLVYSQVIIGFLLMILFRALPDAIWMLAWGEASVSFMQWLFLIDYWFDFFALAPLFVSAVLWAWMRVGREQWYSIASDVKMHRLFWPDIRNIVAITALVTLAAALVTIGKATAA